MSSQETCPWYNGHFVAKNCDKSSPGNPSAATEHTHRAWSMAVEVGFDSQSSRPMDGSS